MAKYIRNKIKETLYGELDFEGSLEGTISMLRDYKKKYAKEGFMDLVIEEDWDYPYHGEREKCFRLIGFRLETDEEFEKRVKYLTAESIVAKKAAVTKKKKKKEKELRDYKRLHKKFKGKV